MIEVPVVAPRNDLESMGVSGMRETVPGRANEACRGDCRFLLEGQGITHPCLMGHGRKDLFARFAMICYDFRLTPFIDESMDRRGGADRRQHSQPVAVDRRTGDRRLGNTPSSQPMAARAVAL